MNTLDIQNYKAPNTDVKATLHMLRIEDRGGKE